MVYEYKRVFGKSDPVGAGARAGFQAYDEQEVYVMHNVTDEVLDGEISGLSWSELPYDTKMRKVLGYALEQRDKCIISEKQYAMMRGELIMLLSKRKLNKDSLVEYDIEKKCIISVPCLVFDLVHECYNYLEEKTNSSIKKTIFKENVSKI